MTTRDTLRLFRVRGGSWDGYPRYCRSAYSNHARPGDANDDVGFRVVCLPGEVAPPRMLLRGGSWDIGNYRFCRSAFRYHFQPDVANDFIGFRVVCLPAPEIVAAAALRALEDHG